MLKNAGLGESWDEVFSRQLTFCITLQSMQLKSIAKSSKHESKTNVQKTSKDESFRKVKETLKVVAKEFKYQGHEMRGPCAKLASGKMNRNAARDMQSGFQRKHHDPVAFNSLVRFLLEVFECQKIMIV